MARQADAAHHILHSLQALTGIAMFFGPIAFELLVSLKAGPAFSDAWAGCSGNMRVCSMLHLKQR